MPGRERNVVKSESESSFDFDRRDWPEVIPPGSGESDSDEFFDCDAKTNTDSSFGSDFSDWPDFLLPVHSTSGVLLGQDLVVRQGLGLCLSADFPTALKRELRLEGESLR